MGVGDPETGDPVTGLLLCAAGWAGGGVMSAVIFQGAQPSVDPTLDPFVSVVAGTLLVGPMVAAALLWQWQQIRMVSTVAALTAVGVVAAVPTLAGAHALIASGRAWAAILLFLALWGVALPVAVRAVVVRLEHPWLDRRNGTDANADDAPPRGPGPIAGTAATPPAPSGAPSPRPGPPVDDRLPPVRIPRP